MHNNNLKPSRLNYLAKTKVPPVKTLATGTAQFRLSSDGKRIDYDLTATNLIGLMMAHIHQGKTGENGQPVADISIWKRKDFGI